MGLYFALQFVFRVLVSNSAELDEAEQLLLTQHLDLGYGSQPPLYTWLLSGLFSIFGAGVATLAAVKNVLLFSTYLFVYKSALEVTGDEDRASVAMLSLLLIPQIMWESQRDLTHSVMGTTLAAATLFVMLRLLKTGALRYYVIFGVCAGVGILSKYNYAFFLVAILVAGGSLKAFRPRLCNRKMLLSLLCLLLVVTPHLYWMLDHMHKAMTDAGKFKMAHAVGRLAALGMGFKDLALAVAFFAGGLVAVYALFFFRRSPGETESALQDDGAALVRRTLAVGLSLCVVMIICFKVTAFKDRWMQPLLFLTPVWLVTLHPERFTQARVRGYLSFCLVVAVTVLILMPGHVLWGPRVGKFGRLNAPYDRLAAALREAGFADGVIVAQGRLVGGNLRLFFPESQVVAPEAPASVVPQDKARLLVWDATKDAALPDGLRDFALGRFASPQQLASPPRYVEATYRHASDRAMRLGFVLLPAGLPGAVASPK
ncbi:glycosyltransferase family 39 protein [Geomonas edaphica]|uniref:glycosyltransferase family 39 protein n=1 Tax=Geomonas edaphica TaxID=2570226 RepID=UPI0013A5E3C6|nr:glycosyltransferase family 39 protein [Geomonas edaphica]